MVPIVFESQSTYHQAVSGYFTLWGKRSALFIETLSLGKQQPCLQYFLNPLLYCSPHRNINKNASERSFILSSPVNKEQTGFDPFRYKHLSSSCRWCQGGRSQLEVNASPPPHFEEPCQSYRRPRWPCPAWGQLLHLISVSKFNLNTYGNLQPLSCVLSSVLFLVHIDF